MNGCFRNLLQPSGVMLRPAVFSLKVYRAEDIPQSEYCVVKCLVSSLGWNYKFVGRYVWTDRTGIHVKVAQGFQRLLNSSL